MSEARVGVHKNEHPSARGNYQSADAKQASKTVTSALDDMPPESASVGDIDAAAPRVAVDMTKENEPVTVRPRITIARTRIGTTWYSFTAGKPCVVPRHVSRVLEEKNII